MGLMGCDSQGRPGAPGPSLMPPPNPPKGTQLAGTVSDAAWRVLAGARVEVVDGPLAGLSTTTDVNGAYWLTGAFDETTLFRATKDGHVAATWPLPEICARCNPQWWLHFHLESLAAPASIAGDYTLTFVADHACALPDDARIRSYAAAVTLTSRAGEPANSRFDVTVTGGILLGSFDRFTIGVAGDYIKSDIGDWGHGEAGLVEPIARNTYVTLGGAMAASVGDPSTITGSFTGAIERCELTDEWGSRSSCGGGAIARARCFSQNHEFRLSRR